MRTDSPVYWDPELQMHVVSRREDVKTGCDDYRRLSSGRLE
ncbi:MAG TPA: hypothetical protein VGH89_20065 [Pseudonocardia sp.]